MNAEDAPAAALATPATPATPSSPAAPAFDRVRVRWLPLWLFLAVALFAPFQSVLEARSPDRRWEFVIYLAMSAAMALWALRQCQRAGVSPRALLGPRPSPSEWRLAVVALPLVPLALGTVWLIWLPLSYAMPDFVQKWILKEDPAMWLSDAPLRSVLAILTMVVVAPIVEEFVFRGVLLQRFAVKWGQVTAVVASSMLFGVLHADILGKTIFGVVMALLYVRTKGLWLPIACHALNNAVAVTLSLLPWAANQKPYTIADFRGEWYVGAISLAVAVAMLYALRDRIIPTAGWRLPVPSEGS